MGLQRHEKPRKPFDVAFPLPGLLHGARMDDRAFAEGRGPDPATKDGATAFVGFPEEDPLLNDR